MLLKRVGHHSRPEIPRAIVAWAINYKDVTVKYPRERDFLADFSPELLVYFRELKNAGALIIHESKLELIVLGYLEEKWSELKVIRHYRPLYAGLKRLEIDFYIASLSLGFEVQDFASHSRTSDSEEAIPKTWGIKKGPIYHAEKHSHFAQQGIEIVELWQDDVLSGSYEAQVNAAISKTLNKKRASF